MIVGVFYKLRDKERSKESAYVLVGFLARPFVSFVSHIATTILLPQLIKVHL